MTRTTIRLPEALATLAFESTAIADAGFNVHAPHKVKGMPDSTAWVSFRVDCPKAMAPREVVGAFRALITTPISA